MTRVFPFCLPRTVRHIILFTLLFFRHDALAALTIRNSDGMNDGGWLRNPLTISGNVTMTGYAGWPTSPQITNPTDATKFGAGLVVDSDIWMIPYNAYQVVKLNKYTGAMTGYAGFPSSPQATSPSDPSKFAGACLGAAYIWIVPHTAKQVIRLDPKTGAMTGYASWPVTPQVTVAGDANKFAGGFLDGNFLWMFPFNAKQVIKMNTATGAMTGYAGWPTTPRTISASATNKFRGGSFDGISIWMHPTDAPLVVKLNMLTGTMTGYDGFPASPESTPATDTNKFSCGCFDGQHLWMIPNSARQVVQLIPETGTMSGYAGWPATPEVTNASENQKFSGACFDGESIWMAPTNAKQVIRIDVKTGVMTGFADWPSTPQITDPTDSVKFSGAVFDGANLFLIPLSAKQAIKFSGSGPSWKTLTLTQTIPTPAPTFAPSPAPTPVPTFALTPAPTSTPCYYAQEGQGTGNVGANVFAAMTVSGSYLLAASDTVPSIIMQFDADVLGSALLVYIGNATLGENNPHAAFNDGVYAYFGWSGGTSISKIDMTTMIQTARLWTPFGTYFAGFCVGGFGFMAGDDASGFHVTKFHLSNMTMARQYQNTSFPRSVVGCGMTDGTFGYFGGKVGRITRLALSTLTFVNEGGLATCCSGDVPNEIRSCVNDGIYGYFGTYYRIVKIRLSSLEFVNEFNPLAAKYFFSAAMPPSNDYSFFGTNLGGGTEVFQIRNSDMMLVGTITAGGVQNLISAASSPQWGYFGGDMSPGNVARVRISCATVAPTLQPTPAPTAEPSAAPTFEPTNSPTFEPTAAPTAVPSLEPTTAPTAAPSVAPTLEPTNAPSSEPTAEPTTPPTSEPTASPILPVSNAPTTAPTTEPTTSPTAAPSSVPTTAPTSEPTPAPTVASTTTLEPTTLEPTVQPTPESSTTTTPPLDTTTAVPTNSSEIITAIPLDAVVQPEAVSASVEATVTIGAAVASPAAAMQVARAQAVLALSRCEGGRNPLGRTISFPRSAWPGFAIGDGPRRFARGSVVAGMVATAAATLLVFLAGVAASFVQSKSFLPSVSPSNFSRILAMARHPGVAALIASLFMEGITSSAVSLIVDERISIDPAAQSSDYVIFSVGLVFLLVVGGFFSFSLLRMNRSLTLSFVAAFPRCRKKESQGDGSSPVASEKPPAIVTFAQTGVAKFFLFPNWMWIARENEGNHRYLTEKENPGDGTILLSVMQHALLFNKYWGLNKAQPPKGGASRLRAVIAGQFFMFELVATFLTGVAEGISVASCDAALSVVLLACAIYLIVFLLILPYRTPVKNILGALIAVATAIGVSMSFAALQQQDSVLLETSLWFASSAGYIAMASVLLSIITLVVTRVTGLYWVPDPSSNVETSDSDGSSNTLAEGLLSVDVQGAMLGLTAQLFSSKKHNQRFDVNMQGEELSEIAKNELSEIAKNRAENDNDVAFLEETVAGAAAAPTARGQEFPFTDDECDFL